MATRRPAGPSTSIQTPTGTLTSDQKTTGTLTSEQRPTRFLSGSALAGRLLDAAYPARCAGCGREGRPICERCLPQLYVRADHPAGTPIGMASEAPPPLLQVEWCAPFTGVVRRALHTLKYGGERRLAVPLGEAMAERWRRAGIGADLIVPVPVHAERARERGYDQAVLLAHVAARELGLPMRPLLERTRPTQAQYQLGHDQRAANVRDAFGLAPVEVRARSPTGRWILLVDDVLTTGSTLGACAQALLSAGAFAVSAVTVARER